MDAKTNEEISQLGNNDEVLNLPSQCGETSVINVSTYVYYIASVKVTDHDERMFLEYTCNEIGMHVRFSKKHFSNVKLNALCIKSKIECFVQKLVCLRETPSISVFLLSLK